MQKGNCLSIDYDSMPQFTYCQKFEYMYMYLTRIMLAEKRDSFFSGDNGRVSGAQADSKTVKRLRSSADICSSEFIE